MEYGGKELCDEKSCHCLLFASVSVSSSRDLSAVSLLYCWQVQKFSHARLCLLPSPTRTLNYGNQKFMVVEPFVYCYKEHLALNVYSLPWLALLWFGKASCFRAAGNKKDPMSPASRHVKNSVSLSHFPNRCQLHSGKVPFRPEIVGCIVSKRHRRGGSFPLEYCMCVCLCMHVHGSLCL